MIQLIQKLFVFGLFEYGEVMELYQISIIKLNSNIKTNGKRREKFFKFPELFPANSYSHPHSHC